MKIGDFVSPLDTARALTAAFAWCVFPIVPACGRANGADVTNRVPIVRVALGDEIAQVVRRSTYDRWSKLVSPSDVDLITVTEPAALAYEGPGRFR